MSTAKGSKYEGDDNRIASNTFASTCFEYCCPYQCTIFVLAIYLSVLVIMQSGSFENTATMVEFVQIFTGTLQFKPSYWISLVGIYLMCDVHDDLPYSGIMHKANSL